MVVISTLLPNFFPDAGLRSGRHIESGRMDRQGGVTLREPTLSQFTRQAFIDEESNRPVP